MPRRGPRPLYKRGDIIESTTEASRWFITGYPSRFIILEVKTFENKYIIDLADPEKRTMWSKREEWFNKINEPLNFHLVVNPVKIWRIVNGEE